MGIREITVTFVALSLALAGCATTAHPTYLCLGGVHEGVPYMVCQPTTGAPEAPAAPDAPEEDKV